jgi:hypothetical protein
MDEAIHWANLQICFELGRFCSQMNQTYFTLLNYFGVINMLVIQTEIMEMTGDWKESFKNFKYYCSLQKSP